MLTACFVLYQFLTCSSTRKTFVERRILIQVKYSLSLCKFLERASQPADFSPAPRNPALPAGWLGGVGPVPAGLGLFYLFWTVEYFFEKRLKTLLRLSLLESFLISYHFLPLPFS